MMTLMLLPLATVAGAVTPNTIELDWVCEIPENVPWHDSACVVLAAEAGGAMAAMIGSAAAKSTSVAPTVVRSFFKISPSARRGGADRRTRPTLAAEWAAAEPLL
jgi:hypothetical protein